MTRSDQPPKFKDGDQVTDTSRSKGIGIVQGEPRRVGGKWMYSVRYAAFTESGFEHYLLPIAQSSASVWDALSSGRLETLDAFRRAQAVARLRRDPNTRSTVFSFNSLRVQFQPHQYRPLLKMLESETRRLLIADEVGLGKTIEAGLILSELDARSPLKRVLVVCPSRLLEKWREELQNKFGYEFEVWGATDLRNHASRAQTRIDTPKLRAIISLQSLRGRNVPETLMNAIGHLDLLIVDESHHVRNPDTQSFQAVQRVAAGAGAAVFLSATPIQLRRADLFNQLQLLHAQEYQNERQFEAAMLANEGVVQAQALVRRRNHELLIQAADKVRQAFRGNSNTGDSRLVQDVVKEMESSAPASPRAWLDLDRRLERLHATSGILTRARKREVQMNSATRRSHILKVDWTDEESRLYTAARRAGGSDFACLARERMAASSLWAYLRHAEEGQPLDSDLLSDLPTDAVDGDEAGTIGDMPTTRTPAKDSKLVELLRILRGEIELQPSGKTLIFTYFVGTSKYLEEQLLMRGIKCLRIAGDISGSSRDPERNERLRRVRSFKDDPDIRVLISTEVGSEGLDFQFCDTLVNYDLPWNPMTVEQRIGRLDRFGQLSPVIKIFSLVVRGTIEERVLARLYTRINIFEQSIGPLESIIGQPIDELRRDLLCNRLSEAEEQQRVKLLEESIVRQRQELDHLEQHTDKLVGHDDYVREELDRVRNLGRYLTPEAIKTTIEGFLGRVDVENRLLVEGPNSFKFRLTDKIQQAILAKQSQEAVSSMRRHVRSDMYRFTTQGDIAYNQPDLDLVNASHPLIQVASSHLEELLEDPGMRCGTGLLELSPAMQADRNSMPQGTFLVATFRFALEGLGARSLLFTVAVDRSGSALDPEVSERLLHLVLTSGTPGNAADLSSDELVRTSMAVKELASEEYARLDERQQVESDFLRSRCAARIEREYEYQMGVEDRRELTAESTGAAARMRGMIAAGRQKAADNRRKAVEELQAKSRIRVTMDEEPVALCLVRVLHRDV